MKRALELGEWRLRASHEPQLGGHFSNAIVAPPRALLHLVDGWHAEAVANQGIRSPEQARRTRRQLEGVLAPQPRARSRGAEGSAPRHARTARPWHCGAV